MATATSEHLLDLIDVRELARSGEAREIRTAAGLSLADVAGSIGVAAATVHRWELGARKPYGEPARRYGALLTAVREHLNESRPAIAAAGLDEDDRGTGRHERL